MVDTSNGTARVPAWKRIGLKLKYAKDTAEENTPPTSNSSPNLHQEPIKPGKRPAEDAEPETPVKRVKASKSEKPKHGLRESTLTSQAFSTPATKPPKKIVFDDDDEPGKAKYGRPASLRKSVSFTPDTKVEDGFSASNFFKAWVNGGGNEEDGEGKAEESVSPSKEAPKEEKLKKKRKSKSTSIPAEASTEEPKPKDSKDKKSKKSKKSAQQPTSSTTPPKEAKDSPPQPYIAYLLHHHTSKPTWKFNKKHQNNLLKNLFNIYRIPPTHNAALIDYISGLQGSARLRVAQEAGEILLGLAGEEALEVKGWEARRDACFAGLEERVEEFEGGDAEGQESEDRRRDLERGKRAKAILEEAVNEEEILSTVFGTSGGEKASASTTTTLPSTTEKEPKLDDKPQKRKRKARTDVSSSSSSSSDSSSSESSSSSSSESDSDSD